MARVGDMIESKYLKQTDVHDETLVTVVKVGKANVAREGDEPEFKWLIRFKEFTKPMVLNSTNIKRLARACGDDTDEWTGKQVMLYVDPDVEFAGNVVGGLRVRGLPKAQPETRQVKDAPNGGKFDDMMSDVPFDRPFRGMLWHVV